MQQETVYFWGAFVVSIIMRAGRPWSGLFMLLGGVAGYFGDLWCVGEGAS